jgi:hypothetical protein
VLDGEVVCVAAAAASTVKKGLADDDGAVVAAVDIKCDKAGGEVVEAELAPGPGI